MRLISCRDRGRPALGIVRGDDRVLLSTRLGDAGVPDSMLELIDAGPAAWEHVRAVAERADLALGVPLGEVVLEAPLPRPRGDVLCLGLNYASSIAEAANDPASLPAHPFLFTKSAGSVVGSESPLPLHADRTREVDWEVELGVVVGRGGWSIDERDALDHVFGYTVVNDVTARDLQRSRYQYFLSKSLPGFCPMGPSITTVDELGAAEDLRLRCWVNGDLVQDDRTSEQRWSVRRAVAEISRYVALVPGQVLSTGTPAGIGMAQRPPRFLRPGDLVECEVEGIGRIRNRATSER